jgi:DNA-binding transcriptional MerR regulator
MTGQAAPPGPRLLRPAQVQALLGVGRTTVHDYESRGDLIATRTLGGHRRYPADQPRLADALAALQDPQ